MKRIFTYFTSLLIGIIASTNTLEAATYYMKNNWGGAEWTWMEMTASGDNYILENVVFGGTGVNYNTAASDEGAMWVALTDIAGDEIAAMDVVTFILDPQTSIVTASLQISDAPQQATAKFYITGNAALVGDDHAWSPTAIAVTEDSYTFFQLSAGDYSMKITLDGTWNTAMGYTNLTEISNGLTADNDGNITFSLIEPSDVIVTYAVGVFKVEGAFSSNTQSEQIVDGYYLIGTHNNWSIESITANDLFTANADLEGEYSLHTTLIEGQGIKVIKILDSSITTWYPEGDGNEYIIDAAHAGAKTIYFRPAYSELWSEFGGYFYIEPSGNAPQGTNYYVIGDYPLLSTHWDITSQEGLLTQQENGNYTYTIESLGLVAGQKYEYRIIANNSWDVDTYPRNDSNYSFTADQTALYSVTFSLTPGLGGTGTPTKIGYQDISTYTIMGDSTLMGVDWSAGYTANDMTSTDDRWQLTKKGVYLPAGTYYYEVAGNHDPRQYMYPVVWHEYTIEQSGTYDLTFTLTNPIEAPSLNLTATNAPCPVSGTCGAEGDNLTWVLSCDSVLTISGSGAMEDYNDPSASNIDPIEGGFDPSSGASPKRNARRALPRNYSPWFSLYATIKTIVIESGVTHVGNNAFNGCTVLTSVSLPEGLQNIGENAFNYCINLHSIDIPSSVSSISSYAFMDCTQLESIICRATTPPTIWTNTFISTNISAVYVPSESISSYQSANGWNSYVNIQAIGSGNTGGEVLPTVALAGTMNGWDYTTQTFTPSDDNQTASLTIALAADTYEFKIVEGESWFGKNGGDGEYYTLHRDWPTAYELENSDGAGNILLTADAAGEYTFIWTYSTKNLQVVFPGQTPSTDKSYYLVGNTEQLGAWSLENALPMESGAITLNLPAGTYSFKVLPQNDGWDGALGYNNFNSGCSSENITTDVDGNLVVTFSEAGELHVSVADGLLCVTGTFSYTSEFVNFTVDVTPEGSGYVYPTSGSYQRGSTLSLEASISTGGWMFDQWSDNGAWDNPRSLYLTQDTSITAIFSPGEYGILINGNRLVRGTFTERLNGSYIAQFRASASLSAGDQIKIINLFHGNNSSWRPELEEGGLSESFSVGDAELICNQAGCYDIYMKIAYGQSSDYVYIGGGTDCSTGEPFGTGDIYVYSVVGTANLFGTAWDKVDTQTEMTLQGESMYAYTLDSVALWPDSVYEYKVISNHEWNVQEWPNFEENYNLFVEEPGVYQVLFMLNPGTGCTATTNYLHAIQDEQPCGIIASGECGADGANVTWVLSCDSILTIGGEGRMADYNEETTIAPWYEYRDAYHSVYIAAGVLNAGDLAFRQSPNLRYVDLASTVVSLGNYSFYDCPNLHSLTLPESVTTLSDNTPFGGTTTMTNPVFNSSVFVRLPEEYAGEYTVAEGTTVIASQAFKGCNQLTSLVLPNTVHILSGSSVFENCTMLVSVNIPEGVTALGEFTFSNCSSLKAIDLPSTLASLGSYCFGDCWMIESITCRATTPPEANGSSLSGVNYMIPIYVPAGTAEIYKAADGWSGFTDYRDIIDGCVVASGECGAEGNNLMWILYCDSVMTIRGTGAMENYSVNSNGQAPWAEYGLDIRDIVIEEGVSSIGSYAFYNAGSYTNGAYNNVRSVSIPSTVGTLTNNYFYQCPIQTVTINSDSIVGRTTYSSNSSLHKMFGAQVRKYIIGDSVKSIANSVFYNQSADSIESILLPEGLTSIGSWAFGYLENLDSITLPSGLLSIGNDAFYGSGLRAVTIPGSVTDMGGQAFQNCDKLASVILEEGLTTLGTSAFQNCTALTEITIPESMVTISSGAFTDCTHLTKMTILATEWVGADKSSSSTTKLAIGNYVRELILGDQIPTIGKYAFSSLDSLRTVTLPFNVTSISNYAFSSCPSLTCVISNALTPPTIQSTTFSTQDTLIVPCESKQLYKTAQYWQNFKRIRCADDQEVVISLTHDWTFIMLPSVFGMNTEDIIIDGEVEWGMYDGERRASGMSGWQAYNAANGFSGSQAYIVHATNSTATLTINVPAEAREKASAAIPLTYHPAAHEQNANWCFIGNPYPYPYNITAALNALGIETPVTIWNSTGYSTYTPGIDEKVLQPFESFFIQLQDNGPEVLQFTPMYIEEDYTPIEGELSGAFSVSESTKVHFSKGNLQYRASTGTWRFAEHQYDFVGGQNDNSYGNVYENGEKCDNKKISATYDGWIDLFGWGTGDDPTKTVSDNSYYTNFTDWGLNAIINGGNEANMWRTLTHDEIFYLFLYRPNAQSLFGFGNVNGVDGLFVLPDNWVTPEGITFKSASGNASYDSSWYKYYNGNGNNFSKNVFTDEQWSIMEAHGAVFIPVAGERWATSISEMTKGFYWSSSLHSSEFAYYIQFDNYNFYMGNNEKDIRNAMSVRLVR